MDSLRIRGGNCLKGDVDISGAKNSALKLMCATLLTDKPVTIHNLPRLLDINTLADLLNHMGVTITTHRGQGGKIASRSLTFDASDIAGTIAPYDFVRKMRASILVLGPLVARAGDAIVSLPGGCAIGTRPIDLHLKALTALGADIDLADGYVRASAPQGLKGARITFPLVSVGATENTLMAATLAKGTTIIENAAREPEIQDLASFLGALGAKIKGAGTSTITIEGVDSLKGAEYSVMPDRIEAGSYAIAAAMTGGQITLNGARFDHMAATLSRLSEAGCMIEETKAGIQVTGGARLYPVTLVTQPYPGFATDMQAQFMALASVADGVSAITEAIFENRFMHVSELCRLGANITVNGATATIQGGKKLKGAPVMATDLRASMSLILAGLAAEGETIVNRLYHLDRGYERLEEKLRGLGADVERIAV